ncbi:hypothetical protein [Nitrospira sp. Kam-Ns4a]
MTRATLLKIVVGSLLALSLIVIPVVLATSALASEQPTGAGPSSQTEVQKDTKAQPPGGQPKEADSRELTKESERPLSVPEGEESSHFISGGETLTPEMLEELRFQDEISSRSF